MIDLPSSISYDLVLHFSMLTPRDVELIDYLIDLCIEVYGSIDALQHDVLDGLKRHACGSIAKVISVVVGDGITEDELYHAGCVDLYVRLDGKLAELYDQGQLCPSTIEWKFCHMFRVECPDPRTIGVAGRLFRLCSGTTGDEECVVRIIPTWLGCLYTVLREASRNCCEESRLSRTIKLNRKTYDKRNPNHYVPEVLE